MYTTQGVFNVRYESEKDLLISIANGDCQMTEVKADLSKDGGVHTICKVVAVYNKKKEGKLCFQFNPKAMRSHTNNWTLNIKKADARTLATFLGLKGWSAIYLPGYGVTEHYAGGKQSTSTQLKDLKRCFGEDGIQFKQKPLTMMPQWFGHGVFCATSYEATQGAATPKCVAPFLMDAVTHPDLSAFIQGEEKDVLHAPSHAFDKDPVFFTSKHKNVYEAPRCIAPTYDECADIDGDHVFTP